MDFICKSPETILRSLSDWFDCPVSDIISILKEDWEAEFIKARNEADDFYYNHGFASDDEELLEHFGLFVLNKGFSDYPIKHNTVNIHWFHGSRVIDIGSFKSEGILPLKIIMPRITKQIDSIARHLGIKACEDTDSSWTKQRIEFKLENAADHGPCAMLMYEAAINANVFNCHSYIEEPEIVSDYAFTKYGEEGNRIVSEFKIMSKPVVVEFIEVRDCNEPSVMDEILRAALTYMYDYLHDEEKSLESNTCYSGYGRTVSKERIIDVIVL